MGHRVRSEGDAAAAANSRTSPQVIHSRLLNIRGRSPIEAVGRNIVAVNPNRSSAGKACWQKFR